MCMLVQQYLLSHKGKNLAVRNEPVQGLKHPSSPHTHQKSYHHSDEANRTGYFFTKSATSGSTTLMFKGTCQSLTHTLPKQYPACSWHIC